MNDPNFIPEVVGATAQAVVQNANRLGLSWNIRLATLTGGSVGNFTSARYDGDAESINMVSMIGPLKVGGRVYVLEVPPAGNFIVGYASGTPVLGMAVYNNVDTGDPATGTTTSASYSNMPGPMSFTVNKIHEETRLLLGMGGTWFESTGTAGTSPAFGMNIAGASTGNGDVNMTGYRATIPAGVVRLPIPTCERLAPCGSGLITVTARWLRNTGAGTIAVAVGVDHLYMKAQEVWV